MRAFFLLFCCFFNCRFTYTTTNSITLRPLKNNRDGIKVVLNEINKNVIVTPNEWNINVSSISGWDIHISMNNSWKLTPDRESIFTFKVYSESITNTPHKNIIFTISQNKHKYLTSSIEIPTNSSNNRINIYPNCISDNEPQSLLANGDIDLLLTQNNNNTQNREYKLSNGSNYKSITTNISNKFPLIIQLANDPINQWSKYTYVNMSKQCKFEPFSTDYPLDIFISAAEIGQILDINKIEISLSYNQTDLEDNIIKDVDSNDNNETEYSDIEVFIDSNHKAIAIILTVITMCLFVICIVLMGMLIKLSIDHAGMPNIISNNSLESIGHDDTIASEMSEFSDDNIGNIL